MSRKIGVIGSGIVGRTLAGGFVTHGYDVMIGTNTVADMGGVEGARAIEPLYPVVHSRIPQ